MKQKSKNSIDRLNVAIDYIEKHVHDKLTLDQIAIASNISKFHLHRIFKAITQQKMMDYVRNRKLSHSIQVLLHTNFKLIDIAYQFGFDYEQSYIRSFYRLFKMTPTQFRKVKPQVVITDKINLSCLQELGNDRFVTNPSIVIKPEFWLVGTKHILRYDDEDLYNKIDHHGNEFFYHKRRKIPYPKAPHMYIGMIKYLGNTTNYSDYITAIEVSRIDNVPPNMVSYFIPSQKYAVFTYIGLHSPEKTTLNHVLGIYEYIFKKWLPQSDYMFTGRYQLEYINSSIAHDHYCEIELHIPITSKKQPLPPICWLDGV